MHRVPSAPVGFVALALLVGAGCAHAQQPADVEFFATELTDGLGLPFSEAVRVGDLLFLAGMIALRPGTVELVPGGMEAEARQTMAVEVESIASLPKGRAPAARDRGHHSERSGRSARGEEEWAVIAAAQALLDVINTRDDDAARELLLEEGSLVRVIPTPEGGRPEAIPREAFARSIGGPGPALFERMWDPEVRIHGPIATVWTPYDFYVDGEFSHCGINAFNLIQAGEEWKVASVVYTVEREGCPASPLGEPGF